MSFWRPDSGIATLVQIFSVADPDPEYGAFLTPGSGMGKKIRIRIWDEQPGSYFRELSYNFLGYKYFNSLLRSRIWCFFDPQIRDHNTGTYIQCCGSGSGIRCLFDPLIGMGKKSGSGSGMNNPDHISEHLETIFFGVKILKFFDADPGWKKFGYEIRGGKNSDPG